MLAWLAFTLFCAALRIGWRFDRDIEQASARAARGSLLLPTRARDDRYGTFANAQYTASQIDGARFIGFEDGGHTWVGHDDEVRAAIVELLFEPGARLGQ